MLNEMIYFCYKRIRLKEYNKRLEKGELGQIIDTKLKSLEDLNIKQAENKRELQNLDAVISDTISEEEQKIIDEYYEALKEKEEVEKDIEVLTKK